MPDLIRVFSFPQLERLGALLVEFETPLVTGSKLPAQRQSVILGEDVIQFSSSTKYSLQPGDKVLAPWEPDRRRYGPATVLGLEARDPQRGKGSCADLAVLRRSQAGIRPEEGTKGVSTAPGS